MYDTFILGQISEDINIDYDGYTINEIGGAVIYSGFAASALGHEIAVLNKGTRTLEETKEVFAKAKNLKVYNIQSKSKTSIKNQYLSKDKEKRLSTAISRIEPYEISDIPNIPSHIYHLAGLMRGDLPDELIPFSASRAKVALDVQGVLRYANDKGEMKYLDWEDKEKYIPFIHFLKTDAMEAKVLTGYDDRVEAAKKLAKWGAKEVMITHNTEVLVYREDKIYTRPLKPRNLSGRSGRGDTCFSTYINERLNKDVDEALLMAAATVSLKMETPGPFNGNREEIKRYIEEYYLKG